MTHISEFLCTEKDANEIEGCEDNKDDEIRDRSKFTGYLGRVLGKICLKKFLRPPFLVEKSLDHVFLIVVNKSK